ncbi:MAG: flagellar basal-body rod protein FlgF [Alphaproteobacteria bacterium]|nr:flagellar basal-body rod protein FlgF [Alphaproteobacteria bacterium]
MQSPSLVLLSGQQALQRAMDIVANNVANASTTGFKRQGIEFDTLLTPTAPGQGLNFVLDRATYRDVANGPIVPTGNQLDLAIQGKGYFQVQTPEGTTAYTRNGAFQLDSQGRISTLAGQPVLGDGGQPITVPNTVSQINIGDDGAVTARVDNGANLAQLGKISIVKFENEQQMQPKGNGLYGTSQISAPAVESFVVQGAIEESNVQPVTEITQMIQVMRAYERASTLISQENQRLNTAITTLSKTTF